MAMRTKMTTAIVILTLACTAGSWGRQIQPSQQAGAARAPQEAVSQLSSGVVTLVAKDASGRLAILEYGFFADPWTIVTGYPPFNEAVDKGEQVAVIGMNARTCPVNLLTGDQDRRLLFMDMEYRGPLSLPLGRPDKINPGDKIYLLAEQIAAGLRSPEAYTRVWRSVVTLVGGTAEGQKFLIGGGFFVDEWTIVTNYYLVKGALDKQVRTIVGLSLDGKAKYTVINLRANDRR
jgi:hypothetical protein